MPLGLPHVVGAMVIVGTPRSTLTASCVALSTATSTIGMVVTLATAPAIIKVAPTAASAIVVWTAVSSAKAMAATIAVTVAMPAAPIKVAMTAIRTGPMRTLVRIDAHLPQLLLKGAIDLIGEGFKLRLLIVVEAAKGVGVLTHLVRGGGRLGTCVGQTYDSYATIFCRLLACHEALLLKL